MRRVRSGRARGVANLQATGGAQAGRGFNATEVEQGRTDQILEVGAGAVEDVDRVAQLSCRQKDILFESGH